MQLANGIVAPDAIILEEKKYRTPWSKSLRIYFWIVVVMIFFALSASAEERMLGEQIDGFRLSMSENEEGTRFKLLDKDGHQVGDSHSFIGEIQNGFVVIGDGVKYGIMDLQGKITVPFAYDYIQYVTDSVFCAFNDKGITLVSGFGEVVAFFEAEHAELVYVDGIYINFYCTTGAGLLRVDGKMMIEPIWEEVSTPHCGMIRCSGEECYYYDENGHQIFKCAIGFNFSDNLAHAVSDLGEDIIVDTSGKVLYTSRGEKALVGIFSNGVCQAMDTESGKYGYVGKDGSWIIQPIYDSAMYFRDGYAAVEFRGEFR